jgi:hypothetical protein
MKAHVYLEAHGTHHVQAVRVAHGPPHRLRAGQMRVHLHRRPPLLELLAWCGQGC